jgi:predicted  nucleic acid-binding Zn ribbon protein
MSRTKGSGWGGGIMLYQICPECGRKKVLYDPLPYSDSFKCTACKIRFTSNSLINKTYLKQLK